MVDPSDTATSRSSLMPIDRSRTPTSSARRRSIRNPSRAAWGGPVRPTVINPSTVSPAGIGSSTGLQ